MKKKFSQKLLLGLSIMAIMYFFKVAQADSAEFGVYGLKQEDIQTSCQMINNAGIKWHRGAVLWSQVVDNYGNFRWKNLDTRVEELLNHEIKIIFTLRSIHEIFAPGSNNDTSTSAPPAPAYVEKYKEFVRNVVERYDGDGIQDAVFISGLRNIKHWQIENEPGVAPVQGSEYWYGTAPDYANLYILAYQVAKEADPEAEIALSGFASIAIEYFMKHGNAFPLEVLKIIDEKGSDFDIFDLHSYKDYRKLAKIMAGVDELLGTYAQFASKPVWVTETNVDVNQIDPYATMDEYNRFVAKDLVRRYSVLLGEGIQKVFWFNFSDKPDALWAVPMLPEDFKGFRGLTYEDLQAKPVYYTSKLSIEKINGLDRVTKPKSAKSVWIYKFYNDYKRVYVMWYDDDNGGSKAISMPLPWKTVTITHIITEPDTMEPTVEIKATENGMLRIVLDDSPIFVEGN